MRYAINALDHVPLIQAGDDLCQIILDAAARNDVPLEDDDIIVLAQKIVSKAEGRQVALNSVTPSAAALELANSTKKDPRLVELILSESQEVVRQRPQTIIVRHKLGLVLANAGIDQSNVDGGDGPQALPLPLNPDESAAKLRTQIEKATGKKVAVLIIDSLGRAWRIGTVGTAIGVAGLPAIQDLRGRPDLTGRLLETSELGVADEIAASASLAMGQSNEGRPIVVIKGLTFHDGDGKAADMIRPKEMDLFQ